MKKSICLGLMVLVFTPVSSTVWATTDLTTLGTPAVTISPKSGPPGTPITIKVSNLSDISKESYPYPSLYIYLPFSKPFGVTLPSHCGGQDCFPVYIYGDTHNGNFADRTITFTLFSQSNPTPVYLDGAENTVCDVMMNGQKEISYLTLCNTRDQLPGIYDIQLAWALETNPDQNYLVVNTLQFTVTQGAPVSPPVGINPADQLIKQYQNNTISQYEFETKLRALGWTGPEIHQAEAVAGKLPHQVGAPAPEQMLSIQQGVQKASQVNNQTSINTTTPAASEITPPSTFTPASAPTVTTSANTTSTTNTTSTQVPKSGCLIATAAFGSELASQVQQLRETRDNVLLHTKSGTAFIAEFNKFYYTFSPTVADWERENPIFKEMVKTTITPLIMTLSILNYVPINSEAEILFYGIGVILLNIGMYFVAPAIVIQRLKQRKN